MKHNTYFMIIVVGATVLLANCTARVINTEELSPYYQLNTISRSFSYQQHEQLFVRSQSGKFEYLGSLLDEGWAGKSTFGFTGLQARNIAISKDGRTIVYQHISQLGGRINQKEGGLYRHVYAQGDSLLLKDGQFAVTAVSYPKPLPPDMIRLNIRGRREEQGMHGLADQTDQILTAEGIMMPLLLLGGNNLHQAAFSGDIPAILPLLRQDSSLMNELTFWDMTPLEVAILKDKQDLARQLLSMGAGYNKSGTSLLNIASMYHRHIVVDELLKKNVGMAFRPIDGNTPLHATLHFMRISSVYPGREDNDEDKIATITAFLNHGIDINMRDGQGKTLLHLAESTSIAKFLIERGIDPDAVDFEGNTALHHTVTVDLNELYKDAWTYSKLPLLESIVLKMKNIDIRNNYGVSPLQRAVQLNKIVTAEYLISRGADARVAFIHGGMGPKIAGQSIQDRIDYIKKEDWWKEGTK